MRTQKIHVASAARLPVAPTGFVWHTYQDTVFLKPSAWHECEHVITTNTFPVTTYATSPERFSATKPFETGLTIQIIGDAQRIAGIAATQMAAIYLHPFLSARPQEELLLFEQDTRGDCEITFCRFTDAPPNLKPIVVHKFIAANNISDRVHVFTFESPVPFWDDNWVKYGTPMLSQVVVDVAWAQSFTRNNLH